MSVRAEGQSFEAAIGGAAGGKRFIGSEIERALRVSRHVTRRWAQDTPQAPLAAELVDKWTVLVRDVKCSVRRGDDSLGIKTAAVVPAARRTGRAGRRCVRQESREAVAIGKREKRRGLHADPQAGRIAGVSLNAQSVVTRLIIDRAVARTAVSHGQITGWVRSVSPLPNAPSVSPCLSRASCGMEPQASRRAGGGSLPVAGAALAVTAQIRVIAEAMRCAGRRVG